MNLIIDEGNSRIKIAVYHNLELLDFKVTTLINCRLDLFFLKNKYNITSAILSSVTDEIISVFSEMKFKQAIILDRNVKFLFKNKYKTPETLGVDRLALTAAAHKTYFQENSLIIDAGTCITYDFINAKEEYLGGGISPGLQMRFNAMHHFTEKLPQITDFSSYENIDLIGDSTINSMLSGGVYGLILEIDGLIDRYKEKYGEINVILTGGDANFLSNNLKNSIFVNRNFLLEGLNYILIQQSNI